MLTTATKPSLTIKRRFKTTPEKVYEAWTNPEKIALWWGPGNVDDVLIAETDVRVGGRFRIRFRAGADEHESRGEYHVVWPHEQLEFTWYWHTTPERESYVKIHLKRDGDGTLMTFTHEQFFDEAARDGHQKGWSEFFDKLEAAFA